ncbi:MAG: ABC transporter family substrate-binding protein, partial [Atopobiaceae bacterium]|nr:ABC transporter family substrate-binding protein [Atopobiaceae bacterium]
EEVDTTGGSSSGSAELLSNFSGLGDKAQIRRGLGLSIAVIEVNSTRGVLQDVAVRKAFCQVVDPATLVSVVFQGVNWKEDTPGSMLWPYWAAGYENNLPDDVKNLKSAEERTKAAKKTLEDAGYSLNGDFYEKDGQQVTFAYTMFGDGTNVKNRAAAIQKMCKDAGINMTLDSHPSSEFSKVLTSGSWDVCLFGWNGTSTSYNNGVQLYGSTSASNFGKQGSADTDAMFAKVVSTKDFDERIKLMNQAEKKIMETYSYLPVYTGSDCYVVKKGLANFGPRLFEDVPNTIIGWQK